MTCGPVGMTTSLPQIVVLSQLGFAPRRSKREEDNLPVFLQEASDICQFQQLRNNCRKERKRLLDEAIAIGWGPHG